MFEVYVRERTVGGRGIVSPIIPIIPIITGLFSQKQAENQTFPNTEQLLTAELKWSLNNNHDLILTLDKKHKIYAGDKLTIKGEIKDAKANKLVFSKTIPPRRWNGFALFQIVT